MRHNAASRSVIVCRYVCAVCTPRAHAKQQVHLMLTPMASQWACQGAKKRGGTTLMQMLAIPTPAATALPSSSMLPVNTTVLCCAFATLLLPSCHGCSELASFDPVPRMSCVVHDVV